MACAKMIGITPELFTLIGIKSLLPEMSFALRAPPTIHQASVKWNTSGTLNEQDDSHNYEYHHCNFDKEN